MNQPDKCPHCGSGINASQMVEGGRIWFDCGSYTRNKEGAIWRSDLCCERQEKNLAITSRNVWKAWAEHLENCMRCCECDYCDEGLKLKPREPKP